MLDGRIREILGDDRVADHFSMKVERAEPGLAVVTMEVDERHLNGNATAHGGVSFSLADVTFALASNLRGPSVSANSSITFCAPARSGSILRATATEVSLSRKLGTYQVVVADGDGRVIALFQGLAYRKGE